MASKKALRWPTELGFDSCVTISIGLSATCTTGAACSDFVSLLSRALRDHKATPALAMPQCQQGGQGRPSVGLYELGASQRAAWKGKQENVSLQSAGGEHPARISRTRHPPLRLAGLQAG